MIRSRLQKIANFIEEGSSIVDVGCDHALLDIYLTKEKNCDCIASDINEKALETAKKNIKEQHLEDKIKIFLNDGLKNLEIKKKSTVVIAGMGTSTILEIIKHADLINIEHFIIQTNHDYPLLRKVVTKKYHYYIEDEIVFQDRKKTYILMKFSKGNKKYSHKDYYLGPILRKKRDLETISYFQNLYCTNKEILQKLPFKYIFKRWQKKYQNLMIQKRMS